MIVPDIFCKECGKPARVYPNGYHGNHQYKWFKSRSTGECYIICYGCLRKMKKEFMKNHSL